MATVHRKWKAWIESREDVKHGIIHGRWKALPKEDGKHGYSLGKMAVMTSEDRWKTCLQSREGSTAWLQSREGKKHA